jgi:hypothetical protein
MTRANTTGNKKDGDEFRRLLPMKLITIFFWGGVKGVASS